MSIKKVKTNNAAEEIFRQAKEAQEKEDYEKALELFEKAAEMGYAPAYVETGKLYDGWGDFELRDWDKAVYWTRKGVEAGDPGAMYLYGHLFELGHGVNRSAQKAFHWTKRAYETRVKRNENPQEELRWLGNLYLYGIGTKLDAEKGIARMEQAAALGYAAAMEDLGSAYYYGKNVEKNPTKAAAWFEKAALADSENFMPLKYLGEMYEEGNGVEQNLDKAAEWYEKAAKTNGGEERVIDDLIRVHTARNDLERANYWRQRKREQKPNWTEKSANSMDKYMERQFKRQLKEAEAGDRQAMALVALSYQRGSGVEKNGQKAVEWHTKTENWYALAKMYQSGDGVEKDLEKAAMYYEKTLASGFLGCNGEDLPLLIKKLRAGEDGLPKEVVPTLTAEETKMDGEALYRRAELAARCNDHKKELLLYKRAAEIGYVPAYTTLGKLYADCFCFPPDYEESMRWLQRGAEAGDPAAVYEMSEAYWFGRGVENDEQKVVELLEKAAAMGYPRAMYELGNKYRERRGVAKDIHKAISWYEKAAALAGTEPEDAAVNYAASSMYILGNVYAAGEDVPQDMKKAVVWYEKAWMAGDKFAWRTIAEIYRKGSGNVPKDEKRLLEVYRKAADMGDGEASYRLGRLYEKGSLVEKDEEKALTLYLKAAEQRSLTAREHLAKYYADRKYPLQAAYWRRKADNISFPVFGSDKPVKLHRDFNEDFQEGQNGRLDWFAMDHYKAEEMDDAAAMFHLGCAYMHGTQGAEKNVEKAVAWYRKAVKAGNGGAMNNLARCYEQGTGVEKDMGKAVALYQEAAELREGAAMYHLGVIAESEELGTPDKAKALDWYRKAAKAWEQRAMIALGNAYEKGDGVEVDRTEAIRWYREGAKMDNHAAILALARIYHKGEETGINAIREKAKALVAATKEPKRHARYANMEDFILDQYGEFLMENTKENMTDAQIAEYLEKEKQLISDMEKELDDYLAEENAK